MIDKNSHASAQRSTQQNIRRKGERTPSDSAKWKFIQGLGAMRSWRREHWLLAGLGVVAAVCVGVIVPAGAAAKPDNIPVTTVEVPLPRIAIDPISAAADATGDAQPEWQIVRVRQGQTLGEIFEQQGVPATELARLLEQQGKASALCHIHPGDEFAFQRGAEGTLQALRFDRDDHTRVVVNFSKEGLREDLIARNVERRTHVARGTIESSLFGAGAEAGMSDTMVLQLADAFGYDIDFAQDLRVGDSFTVIYDDVYREGERLHDGNIIAATFINRGKRYSAFRFTDAKGDTKFYSADGRPLRKTFLRTPVDFTRITSLFSAGRMHPILGTMRANEGCDYPAPQGTAIRGGGEGKVAFRGWQAGYGNVVILQHGGHYSTLYGHMSRFASEAVGQHVSQGQTIGYVGMTGLATGPHLHYEFRVDGAHRDPLTVTTLPPEPLPATELAQFRTLTQPMLAKLKSLELPQPRQLASLK